MNKRDFLLEIGLEEMPARFVGEAGEQLTGKIRNWLDEHAVSYSHIVSYATPRRLAIVVEEMAEKQADRQQEAKGPAKKIALDEAGGWSKAAQGFARSQGVSLEELTFKEIKGVEYVHVLKYIKGVAIEELLVQLKEIITGMTFPKNMRWGSHQLRFVRPIKWMICLFGSTVVPIDITGIHSGRETEGHRFLGEKITIDEPKAYVRQLKEQYVIADVEERQQIIIQQLQALEKEKGWIIPIDPDLLEEVTYLVEYPTAIYGSFDQEFLDIPREVLITSMKEHQRYFPVTDESGQLLPHFITIRNGKEDTDGVVARGNEKVIRARLADARFFYEEDKKLEINQALSQLENVVFHEELGTIGDKVRRVKEIAGQLAVKLELEENMIAKINRSAEICKFDLVSQMVNEFPELQGIMGQRYALLAGEDAEVSKTVFEHYLPRFAGDYLPSQAIGAVVSIADKMDTIVGCFSIGINPTGSQDPYALRRQATGIVQIILDQKWPLTLAQLFSLAVTTMSKRQLMKRNEQEVTEELHQFFHLRLRNRMQEEDIRYDLIDAVLKDYQDIELSSLFSKVQILKNEIQDEAFKPLVDAFTRVNNIANKVEKTADRINIQLFEADIEHKLLATYENVQRKFEEHSQARNWAGAYQALTQLQQPIESYFEQIMVMVEEDQVRYNRLALLQSISQLIQRFADFSQIVFSSK